MSQEKIIKTLSDGGLSRTEAKVYFYLSKVGPKKATDIAKFLRISKQQLYLSLRSLQSKGVVLSSLEHPAKFSGAPFVKVLDLLASAKIEEANTIQQGKDSLLADWQSIVIKEKDDQSQKFTVIEGRKYVYSKIRQMIQETTKQLSTVTTIPSLIRADHYGLLEAAFSHPLRSKVNFRFLTELSESNVDALSALLEKAPKTGFNLKGRKPELGLKLSPRMVIRDNEELLFFTSAPNDSPETCIWTDCKELVQSFVVVFDELWLNSTDIQWAIVEEKNGPPKAKLFSKAEKANKDYEKILNLVKEEIIQLTSAKGLLELGNKVSLLKKYAERGISIKIMAPVNRENLSAATQLSKNLEVRHTQISYPKTIIVDGRHLFQSREPLIDNEKLDSQDIYYIDDAIFIQRMEKVLKNLWKTSVPPSVVTLKSIVEPPRTTSGSKKKLFSENIRQVHSPFVLKDEEPPKKMTEKDVCNMLIDAMKNPNGAFSNGVARTYGCVGQAIIRPPSKSNLPEIMLIIIHSEKYSYQGSEDVIQVFVKEKTPTGRGFLPVVFMADNPRMLELQKKVFKGGIFYKDNVQLIKKDEIQVQMHGSNFFCAWTIKIPLIDGYVLPPGSILLESNGSFETNEFEMHYPSGYKMKTIYNGTEGFVTYFHPSLKYNGPSTDGFIMRDAIIEIYPP
jgi:sugar-specific transcriptional regulator TrmB